MLSGENIVCFSKDWNEDPTSNNHVLSLLAKSNRVLWINSISTRTPQFSSGRDLKKIVRKLKSFVNGAKQVENNLWVYTPIVLPFPHSRLATVINHEILRTTISLLRRKLSMDEFQLWSFIPTASPYVGKLGESVSVYYCTDEWSQFSQTDTKRIVEMEEELCRKVDVVFTTANSLKEKKGRLNPETHLASHGVDYAHFAKALDEDTPLAPELIDFPRPIIGFFGLIHSWFDQDLIAFIADKHPEWTIVLIGKADVDTRQLEKFQNVHLLGRKSYDLLPSYCKGLNVGIIPFVVNELTHHVNPIKLREYLSAGLPVVSTSLPEVRHYSNVCTVADDYNAFLIGLEKAVKDDSKSAREKRSQSMKKETWEAKVDALGDVVRRIKKKVV
ncbi:MAG: glycosyltransferase [Pseudomonadota bacterium]